MKILLKEEGNNKTNDKIIENNKENFFNGLIDITKCDNEQWNGDIEALFTDKFIDNVASDFVKSTDIFLKQYNDDEYIDNSVFTIDNNIIEYIRINAKEYNNKCDIHIGRNCISGMFDIHTYSYYSVFIYCINTIILFL